MARRVIQDEYFRRAKAEGYAARSAYKLIELNDRKKIIRPGDAVLDCGCAPGSWLQVASRLVGPEGVVVGIDLAETHAGVTERNVRAIQGDVFDADPADLLDAAGRDRFDVVLSDMAPATTGSHTTDHFRSVELCRRVLELSTRVLTVGGNLAMKVFEGEAYCDLLRETERAFGEAKGFKPKACRDVSREIYIVGHARLPAAGGKSASNERRSSGGPPAPAPGWGKPGAAGAPGKQRGGKRDGKVRGGRGVR